MSHPDALPAVRTTTTKTAEAVMADSRKWIAYGVVGAYLLLVFANIALPVGLYLAQGDGQPFTFDNLKDLTAAISTVLAGLVGILGFVVGYYFKSVDDKVEAKIRKR